MNEQDEKKYREHLKELFSYNVKFIGENNNDEEKEVEFEANNTNYSHSFSVRPNWYPTNRTYTVPPLHQKGNNMSVKVTSKFDWQNMDKGYRDGIDHDAQKRIEEEVAKNKPQAIKFMGKEYEINPNEFYSDDYIFSPKHFNAIKVILNSIEHGHRINVKATGEAGTGKTSFMQALGRYFNFPVQYMNCAINTNPVMWFGQREIREGVGTQFIKSPFAKFIENHGSTILDEINRPDVDDLNTLFPLMDETGQFQIQETMITRSPNMVFYCTANEGFEYVGTNKLDKAFNDRFHIYLNFDQLTNDREVGILQNHGLDERESRLIVTNMDKIRQIVRSEEFDGELPFSLSIRKSINIAHLVKMGYTPKEAIADAIINGLSEEDKVAFQSIVSGD